METYNEGIKYYKHLNICPIIYYPILFSRRKPVNMRHHCPECDFSAEKKSQLLQHQRLETHWRRFRCQYCSARFTRKGNFDRHMEKHNAFNNVHCQECGRAFSRPDNLQRHMAEKHQIGRGQKRPAETATDVAKRLRVNHDPEKFYTINKIKEQYIEKFRTTGTTYKVTFKDIEVTENIVSTLKKLFTAIFKDLTKNAKPSDLIRMVVQSPSLDYPIVIPFGRLPTLTADLFMSEIGRVVQSHEEFVIDESLIIEVTIVDMPDGGAQKRCKFVNTEKFLVDKRCVIRIRNDDNLCCARAIVTARAKLEEHEKWNSIRQGRDIQRNMAKDLHSQAGVPPGPCGIEEIKKFQEVFPDYQIHIVSADHFNGIIYKGPETEKKIYLYYHENHYDVITSMPAFLSRNYFCTKCNKGYDHAEDHSCSNVCHRCRKTHEEANEDDWIHCEDCCRFFQGQKCFELHKKTTLKGNSTCLSIFRCGGCGKTINRNMHKKKIHVCGEKYCNTCKGFFAEDHLCYMQPEEEENAFEVPESIEEELVKEMENANQFIFFDFECTQDDLNQCDSGYNPDDNGKCQHCLKSSCGSYEHKPNLCVAQKVCTVCMDNDEECENCGQREHVFRGENTLEEFCQWLFAEDNYDSTVLCHNFQGYDSYPILQYLYKNAIVPTIIANGAKIMSLTVPCCRIKMIDSINFLPMALAKLPPMFGFKELKKGYFPHLFNRKENQMIELEHLPNVSYYNPDGMKPKDRSQFIKWYEVHQHDTFNLQKELLEYCKSDVDILRRCCLQFRKDFMNITGIDPFDRCITIASACNLVFRTNFLQPETIGVIPHHGYTPEQKQSVKAMQWIKYISYKENQKIQHAKNGGEKIIGPYRVDGYYENENGEKVVLEFHGDFWHGNPVKYSRSTINQVNQMTMGDLYDKTIVKQKYLENLGYNYKCIWESDFDEQLNTDPEMKAYIEQVDIVTPLEPRDAFYGGRTEAFTLYKKASPEEEINYYDVTSLYPFINKTGKVPTGHPEIITEHFQDISQYEGIIKCKILPPRGLFQPVLPSRMNGKLLFHLCQTCANIQQQDHCKHNEEDRAFVGTWVTDEVKKAIEKGYKVIKLYEVWHFNNISQYDPQTQSGGIFTEYVNTFLKIKQEASGWPSWCVTEKQKHKYIEMYYQKEGVSLDYQNIRKNPGMRALAKLMLNSFWGKFGQRGNKQQVDLVEDPIVYFDKLTSDQEEVTAVNYVSDQIVEMRWKYKDDFVESNPRINVIIAAYTTAQARLKLYSYLEGLGPRALYADTDSVIFSSKQGEWKPMLGDYLGDLTDELPCKEIDTFVTGGPKNYGIKLRKPDEEGNLTYCKIRGITLNYKNSLDINFDVIERFVTETPDQKVTVLDSHKITRDRDNAKLLTISQNKDYRLVFDKRVQRDNYVSYPYGF